MTIFEEINSHTNDINKLLLRLSPGDSPEEQFLIDRASTTMEEFVENVTHIKEAKP